MASRATSAAMQAAAGALAAAGAAREARASLTVQPAKPALSASDRENPNKLTGEDLRALAHRRGISRSELERMDDAKVRMQLRYITSRQYATEEA